MEPASSCRSPAASFLHAARFLPFKKIQESKRPCRRVNRIVTVCTAGAARHGTAPGACGRAPFRSMALSKASVCDAAAPALDAGPTEQNRAMRGARPCNGSFEADTVERMHNVFTPPMWRSSLNFPPPLLLLANALSLLLSPNLATALVSHNLPPLLSSAPPSPNITTGSLWRGSASSASAS